MSPTNFKSDQPTKAQLKAKRDALWKKVDAVENKHVKVRSGGRCEVVIDGVLGVYATWRCLRPATQVHHMIGGWKLRGRNRSALREHKQHVCAACHQLITGDIGKKLVRVGGVTPHFEDRYRLTKA